MGCGASKLGNEDTVRRCKERRRLMKAAVHARHHLAAAHSNYCRSLRETGSALSAFAAGEPLSVSDETPSVVLRTPSTLFGSTTATINPLPPRVPSPSLRPPPPPFSPSPSPNVASSKRPGVLSAASRSCSRRRNPMKLPHILSESSPPSSPQSHNTTGPNYYTYQPNWTLPSTPSQASSVWNWENFHPPSPPDSDYFQRRSNGADVASCHSNGQDYHKHHHTDNEDGWEEAERQELQCSEWGDQYSTTSSSDVEDRDKDSRSEIGTRSNFGSSVRKEPPAWNHSTMINSDKSNGARWKAGNGEISDMKIVVRHQNLAEIMAAIKEYFDKAASAGERVAEMLETGQAQFDSSFRQLRKTVYHSSGMLGNLSSRWSSKPPLAVKYQFEPGSMDQPGGSSSLCSTLERLFAWEKKLYQEVKAREGVKIEHEKKLSALHSQERKGGGEAKLDKTMTSIKRLQSLIVVTSQAVSTTSSAIIGLRDTELVPQLVELCHGFMYMWRSMNQFHEVQNQIVQQVQGLVNRSANGDSTTDLHRQATHDLESAVFAWHSSFCCLTKFQRDFICSLHGWFKLTLFPVNGELANVNKEVDEVFSFCDEWKLALDRLPDTVASEAIKSFINVVHAISVRQTEEVKMKKRTESASKELGKKASALRNIEKKYYHSYYMVGISLPDTGPDNGHALDSRDPLTEKKSELAACRRRVEDETLKLSKAVEATRAMTLNNIQTGLPGVFQAMTSFSAILTEALEVACNRSYSIK